MAYSKEFLEKTIQVWQPYSRKPISPDDAEEIANNAVALFKYLVELDQKYNPSKNQK